MIHHGEFPNETKEEEDDQHHNNNQADQNEDTNETTSGDFPGPTNESTGITIRTVEEFRDGITKLLQQRYRNNTATSDRWSTILDALNDMVQPQHSPPSSQVSTVFVDCITILAQEYRGTYGLGRWMGREFGS